MKKALKDNTRRFFCCLIILACIPLQAQDTLRVATYNLLKFPSEGGAARIDDFRRVVDAMNPDILVVQELETLAGQNMLLEDVLNHDGAEYTAAQFLDGFDTDSGLFYRQQKVTLFAVNGITTDLRLINEYFLSAYGQTFMLYSMHLKAGSTPTDQNRRLTETTILREHLNDLLPNTEIIVVGDYNIRSSAEAAFQELIEDQSDNDGKLFDPIMMLGNWNNNNFFSLIHTQSTRTSSFGGGATGGMDDRFDIILVSNILMSSANYMRILPETYRAFGNDGNKFNTAINFGTNFAVPDSIADALHQASDHLPVMADFVFGAVSAIDDRADVPEAFSLFQNYPNPFNPTTTIQYSLSSAGHVKLTVTNLLGELADVLVDEEKPPGRYTAVFDGTGLAGGIYFYTLQTGGIQQSRKLLLLK